jgi:hypothetical protein
VSLVLLIYLSIERGTDMHYFSLQDETDELSESGSRCSLFDMLLTYLSLPVSKTIREEFAQSTLLTIAHRLSTVSSRIACWRRQDPSSNAT